MLRYKLSILSLLAIGLLPLGSCANTPWAAQLQQSLAADPQLQANSDAVVIESPTSTTTQLPANFPAEIPRYANATLLAVTGVEQTNSPIDNNQPVKTRWQTEDTAEQVQQFYRDRFQAEGWQITPATDADAPLQASRDGLQVAISTTAADGQTKFSIDYQFGEGAVSTASPSSTGSTQPGDPNFIGPVWPSDRVAQTGSASPSPSGSPGDVQQAPTELQSYIQDLAKLGVFAGGSEFKPNAEISRRDYARWLVTANNLIYSDQAARKIRLASGSEKPVFQDVSATDPDFDVIQGLANAGLIPSPLSGSADQVNFKPDAPLTREELILWKVPVDTRQALPNAAIDTIQQTWGFQDGAKIAPYAMRAVAADYQNGDLSNIRRAFGYTTLFQPKKSVSRAEAAAVLWQFGTQGNNLSAKDALQTSQTPTQSPLPSPAAPSPAQGG